MTLAKPLILVVDDDEAVRNMLAQLLAHNGYDCFCVKNGKEALSALRSAFYDLVLTDVCMGSVDGYSLFQNMQQTTHKDTPVIFMSGSFNEKDEGFNGIKSAKLAKPFEPDKLFKYIKLLLSN